MMSDSEPLAGPNIFIRGLRGFPCQQATKSKHRMGRSTLGHCMCGWNNSVFVYCSDPESIFMIAPLDFSLHVRGVVFPLWLLLLFQSLVVWQISRRRWWWLLNIKLIRTISQKKRTRKTKPVKWSEKENGNSNSWLLICPSGPVNKLLSTFIQSIDTCTCI